MEVQPFRRLLSSSICQSCRYRMLLQSRRSFVTSSPLLAQDDPLQAPPSTSSDSANKQTKPSAMGSLFQSASDARARQRQRQQDVDRDQGRQQQYKPSQASSNGDAMGDLASMVSRRTGGPSSTPGSPIDSIFGSSSGSMSSLTSSNINAPFVLHVTTHRHNTHLSLTGPFPAKSALRGPHDRRRSIAMSAGNIGFRKAARGSYDAAFQLASFVFGAINERDILPLIQDKGIEIRYRGFGKGREAVTKALLGSEGRFVKGKVLRVTDVTTLKFGGVRSKKPRRL